MWEFTQDRWKMYRYTLEGWVFSAGFGSEWDTLYNIHSSPVSNQLLVLFATNYCTSWQFPTLPCLQQTLFPRTLIRYSLFPQQSIQISSENRIQTQPVTSVKCDEFIMPSIVAATNLLPISTMDLAYSVACTQENKEFVATSRQITWHTQNDYADVAKNYS